MKEILKLGASDINRLGVDHQEIFGGASSLEHFSLTSGTDEAGARILSFEVRVLNAEGVSVELREHEFVQFLLALERSLFQLGLLPTDGLPRLLPDDVPASFHVDGRSIELPAAWNDTH